MDGLEYLERKNGIRQEDVGLIIGPPAALVFTRRADYRTYPPTFNAPPCLVKLSNKEHAIAVSTDIKLGTPRYYREYEDDDTGIADPEEGQLIQRGSLREFYRKNSLSSPEPAGSDLVSTTVTWSGPNFLMFCTSIMPDYLGLRDLWNQFPDYDCATLIPDPSAFAMQLGKDVAMQIGKNASMELKLSAVDLIIQSAVRNRTTVTAPDGLRIQLDTRVLVTHGPITYCDRPEEIINRFPIEVRQEVIPFVKRRKYAGQREYRFVVNVIGEPQNSEFLMEITDELRSLVRVCPGKSR